MASLELISKNMALMAEKTFADLKGKNVVSENDSSPNNDDAEKKVTGSNDDVDKRVTGSDEDVVLNLPMGKLNLGPRKKLLVLSLGGLLVDRVHVRNKYGVKRYKPDVVYGKFLVFKRPFCTNFLQFCLEKFEVGIWSSAKEHNIDAVLSSIMPGLRGKLAFIWDQEQCTDTGFKTLENSYKPIFLKELNKLWENNYKSLPWRSGEYSASNTLMIDTEPYKALRNPPNTAIFTNEFKVSGGKDSSLGPKGDLQVFLDVLADAKDVPGYVKDHPFGKPAITTSHSDWDYYAKIVEMLDNGKHVSGYSSEESF